MSTFQQHLQRMFILVAVFLLPMTTSLRAQQLPDPHFEDWSGSKFDGKEQLKNWNASLQLVNNGKMHGRRQT